MISLSRMQKSGIRVIIAGIAVLVGISLGGPPVTSAGEIAFFVCVLLGCATMALGALMVFVL